VYAPDGRVLSDQSWYSSYRAEPKIVRVGPKAPKKKKPPVTTTTTTTTTVEQPPAVPH